MGNFTVFKYLSVSDSSTVEIIDLQQGKYIKSFDIPGRCDAFTHSSRLLVIPYSNKLEAFQFYTTCYPEDEKLACSTINFIDEITHDANCYLETCQWLDAMYGTKPEAVSRN